VSGVSQTTSRMSDSYLPDRNRYGQRISRRVCRTQNHIKSLARTIAACRL
jgi:hypothetical protein